ncbi:hypothetical protein CVT26_014800 [Gymnopilus dilepis]|uniref:Uncharacterized protein n=1 Tax=Gymnopilus dilepis TaxID=231916 RepID=A0A409W3Y6_9AGAR|nr:hypothetical protein CVT26_014800 [Gymnopilus dilepis]
MPVTSRSTPSHPRTRAAVPLDSGRQTTSLIPASSESITASTRTIDSDAYESFYKEVLKRFRDTRWGAKDGHKAIFDELVQPCRNCLKTTEDCRPDRSEDGFRCTPCVRSKDSCSWKQDFFVAALSAHFGLRQDEAEALYAKSEGDIVDAAVELTNQSTRKLRSQRQGREEAPITTGPATHPKASPEHPSRPTRSSTRPSAQENAGADASTSAQPLASDSKHVQSASTIKSSRPVRSRTAKKVASQRKKRSREELESEVVDIDSEIIVSVKRARIAWLEPGTDNPHSSPSPTKKARAESTSSTSSSGSFYMPLSPPSDTYDPKLASTRAPPPPTSDLQTRATDVSSQPGPQSRPPQPQGHENSVPASTPSPANPTDDDVKLEPDVNLVSSSMKPPSDNALQSGPLHAMLVSFNTELTMKNETIQDLRKQLSQSQMETSLAKRDAEKALADAKEEVRKVKEELKRVRAEAQDEVRNAKEEVVRTRVDARTKVAAAQHEIQRLRVSHQQELERLRTGTVAVAQAPGPHQHPHPNANPPLPAPQPAYVYPHPGVYPQYQYYPAPHTTVVNTTVSYSQWQLQ